MMAMQFSRKSLLMLGSSVAILCAGTAARAQDPAPDVNLEPQLAQADLPTAAPSANATQPNGTPGQAIPPSTTGPSESITVRAKRLLQKEKNSPSAVTELSEKQIQAAGPQGSPATLLRQAPSVYVYQQGLGSDEPALTIRGARGLEVAATLDDVPMQDLLNGGTGSYLVGNVGARYALSQINGVSIYPGVAYPDKNTFGTIGGTIAYSSRRPSNDYYIDLSGTVGSFGTAGYGVTINSGRLDGPLGSGDNAPKFLLSYNYLTTANYVDFTGAHYNNFEAAFDKPYDDGLSKFQATLLYNSGGGYVQGEPTPVPYLNRFGTFSNYSTDLAGQHQSNDFLTLILRDDTYINDWMNAGVSVFYLNTDSSQLSYENPSLLTQPQLGLPIPFYQVPFNFFAQSDFMPGGLFAIPGHLSYNPAMFNNTASCPASVIAYQAAQGQEPPCGISALYSSVHNDSYGIQPRVTFIVPEWEGIANTIKLGALIAKETQPNGLSYIWGNPKVPQTKGYNQVAYYDYYQGGFDGGSQRTIYLAYAQDKIDLLANTLHITPGGTIEGTDSSNHAVDAVLGNGTIGPYKFTKWDRDFLPFVNVSYDLDRILPAAKGTSLYASYGSSALFAPATDFVPNLTGGAPSASIVHMYEGGVKYDTSNLLLSLDYFYQKVDRDFGFYTGQGPQAGYAVYSNLGQREFKGFEAAGTWNVAPHWQLFGNTSYLLAKYLKSALEFTTVFEDQYGAGIKGYPISGIPDWIANFGVEYDNSGLMRDGDALSIRFSGQYTGQQYSTCDVDASTLQCFDSTGHPIPQSLVAATGNNPGGLTITDRNHKIPEYATFNLLLSYTLPTPQLQAIKNIKFDLNFQNIFDQRYWQYYYSQITPVAGVYDGASFFDGLPGAPFNMTFTITARF